MLGRMRLASAARGEVNPDGRLQRSAKVEREKIALRKCQVYLITLYGRLGETLPHKYRGKFSKRRKRRMEGLDPYGSSSSDDDGEIVPEECEHDAIKSEVFADTAMFTRLVETSFGENIADLPLRFLPPGTAHDLFLDMVAGFSDKSATPSYATFMKAWNLFKPILKFRSKGDFQDCDRCVELKRAVKLGKKTSIKNVYEATLKLKEHYKQVGISREIEESLRKTPPSAPHPVLVVLTDGMDQAKWAIPRFSGWRAAKRFASLSRPKVIVQGVWCCYFGFHVFIGDCIQQHDSSFIFECLARALERIAAISRRKQISVPPEILLWTDNTSRENKNSTVFLNLSLLVARGQFRCATMANHPKGHSHNCLDQVFGVLSRTFQYVDRLDDIGSVKEALQNILGKDSLRDFLNVPEVTVEVLNGCRDWKGWISGLGTSLEGGMRDDMTGLHCWMFMSRRDVPASHNVIDAPGHAPHPCDVVLLAKQWVWDTALSQPPLVILPYQRAMAFLQRSPVPTDLRHPKPPDQNGEPWLKCAQALLRCYEREQVQRSVKYILSLAKGERGLDRNFPQLAWMESCRGWSDVESLLQYDSGILAHMLPAARVAVRFRREQ
eukprot:Skav227031  [mRNA]  locus=scaffold6915:16038:17861:- [translate_table: standard]